MTLRSPLDPWLLARTGLAALEQPELERWQLAELRSTLAWARSASPFHARRLAGIDPATLRAPADLALLPRMDAADLAAPGLLAVSQGEVARVVSLSTSGSSGPPKRLHFSEADLARTLEFFAVGMSTLCGPGDVVLVLLPGRREQGVADLLLRALPSIGARAVLPLVKAAQGEEAHGEEAHGEEAHGEEAQENWPEALPRQIAAQGATVLVAAPTQLRRLLAASTTGFQALRTVLASGEPLPQELRQQVETAWGCEVFDHWGMTETGYGGGVECRAHAGYHLREADIFVEVAEAGTGRPLPPGAPGEILVTTLGRRAMPLVRYRTGDAACWLPGPCPCGSALRRLGPVLGRLAAGGADIAPMPKGGSAP